MYCQSKFRVLNTYIIISIYADEILSAAIRFVPFAYDSVRRNPKRATRHPKPSINIGVKADKLIAVNRL
jgi:hypothetical protein